LIASPLSHQPFFSFSLTRRPLTPPLFPYTTLFRSAMSSGRPRRLHDLEAPRGAPGYAPPHVAPLPVRPRSSFPRGALRSCAASRGAFLPTVASSPITTHVRCRVIRISVSPWVPHSLSATHASAARRRPELAE